MHSRTAVSILLAAAVPALAGAHEGHKHVMGTVLAVDASHVELAAKYGKKVSVALTPETRYLKSDAAKTLARAEDLKVGLRVVIDAEPKGDGLEAKEVRIGVAAVGHPVAPPSPGTVPE